MVLSHPHEISTEGYNGGIREISRANENYVKALMNLEDTAENYIRGAVCSENEITDDTVVSQVRPRIVDVTVRRENGETETYSLESVTKTGCHRLVQDLSDFLPVNSYGARYDILQATACHQENLAFGDRSEAANGDPNQRDSKSNDSSDGGRAKSDKEGRTGDRIRAKKRKRTGKISFECTRILEGFQYGSPENPTVITRVSLRIADENAVMEFYRRILADGQQTLCKKLAKCWIRAINPNKQTNYPYAKGPATKPPWWPLTPPDNGGGKDTKGTAENGFVRHKEPDHLAKPERLTLLPYMLNQITDPRNREQFHSVNMPNLQQASLDAINNENTDKDKHESWCRFINEIFQVARQQERYKNGEIDETTVVYVLISYESWRKGSVDEAEEDSKSDVEYDDDECETDKVLTPRSPFEQDPHIQIPLQPQPLGDDIKQGYPDYVLETRFRLNFPDGINSQLSYRDVNDGPSQMSNPRSYTVSTTPQPRSHQHPSLMLQEPFRRHSDTSDRFSNQGSFVPFLPITSVTQVTNPLYQTPQPVFQFPATPCSPTGPVLRSPMAAVMTRTIADVPHFPAFHDTGLFSRSNTVFQTSVKDPILSSHGNLLQLSQHQQDLQDYLQSQHYDHSATKMHVMGLNNATRPEFRYAQEDESTGSRPEFHYDVKPRCSLESGAFDLNSIANGGPNVHSEHGS